VEPLDAASQDPVDQLIVRLIREEIEASPDDVQRIVDRMATAPFNQHPVRVRARDRGLTYGDIVIGRIADPLELHLAKRVVEEEQWVDGTTTDEYLADLRASARHPEARVLVYERTGDLFAATISPTFDVVPEHRIGRGGLSHLLVVYSALYGTVRTAYMYSDFSELDMPEALRWLR
jgi:hypothetical protein